MFDDIYGSIVVCEPSPEQIKLAEAEHQRRLELFTWLHFMYQSTKVMYQGKIGRIDGHEQGGIRYPVLYGTICVELDGIYMPKVTDCKFVLRSVDSITDIELAELSGIMYGDGVTLEISKLNDKPIIKATRDGYWKDGNSDHDWFPIGDLSPLSASRWFFKNQINFLNLPPEVAVEL